MAHAPSKLRRIRAPLYALPVNALVARIDVERMEADDPPNLTSAIRQWLWRTQFGKTAE